MTYKKGDVLGSYSMGDCPFCEDGDLNTEGDEETIPDFDQF